MLEHKGDGQRQLGAEPTASEDSPLAPTIPLSPPELEHASHDTFRGQSTEVQLPRLDMASKRELAATPVRDQIKGAAPDSKHKPSISDRERSPES